MYNGVAFLFSVKLDPLPVPSLGFTLLTLQIVHSPEKMCNASGVGESRLLGNLCLAEYYFNSS